METRHYICTEIIIKSQNEWYLILKLNNIVTIPDIELDRDSARDIGNVECRAEESPQNLWGKYPGALAKQDKFEKMDLQLLGDTLNEMFPFAKNVFASEDGVQHKKMWG